MERTCAVAGSSGDALLNHGLVFAEDTFQSALRRSQQA